MVAIACAGSRTPGNSTRMRSRPCTCTVASVRPSAFTRRDTLLAVSLRSSSAKVVRRDISLKKHAQAADQIESEALGDVEREVNIAVAVGVNLEVFRAL